LSRRVHRRSDVAKGLLRIDGSFIPESQFAAPHFCLAFELLDKTALPQLAQKAIWAINNAVSCVEKGEEGAYIRGLTGLKCFKGNNKGEKYSIIRDEMYNDEVGGDLSSTQQQAREDGSSIVMKEVDIQIRIHEAKATKPADGDEEEKEIAEHYLFLLVSSPLAFSLRKAVYNTLQLKFRGIDAQYADARRTVWNTLATHVRQGLTMEGQSKQYTELEVLRAHDTSSVDWVNISSSHSFTRLFSVQTSVDWVRNHFFAKHAWCDRVMVEGFGELEKFRECVDPTHISGCMRYDEDVEKAIAKTQRKQKKKSTPRKRTMSAVLLGVDGGAGAGDDDHEEGGDQDGEEVTVLVPFGYQAMDGGDRGYPPCSIAMKVMVPLILEAQVSLYQFYTHAHAFPASVTLDILKKSLGLDAAVEDGGDGGESQFADSVEGGNDNNNDDEDDQLLSLGESQNIVCGKDFTLGRPMLCNGDASWAVKCEKNIVSIRGDRAVQRISYLRGFLRLGFGLALTRSMGSDVYTNERVAQYGKLVEHSSGSVSLHECRETFKKLLKVTGDGKRLGCGTHEALRLLDYTMTSCNSMVWNLRPDNLFLVVQMMVSDIMLCLNYHGSVIGGACNGIGATLVVRDGGGSYRKLFKDPSSSEIGSSVGQIYSKRNGSGADTCVSIYKSVVGISSYDSRFKLSKELISELKRTTELGLMQESCNIVEVLGTETVQTHCVTETMGRKYSTELKAANDPQSQNCMQAITWLIPRNTISSDANIFKSTRENEKTKARIPVEYRQVTYGFWLLCSNSVGNLSRERFRTLVTVSRSVSAAADSLDPIDAEKKKRAAERRAANPATAKKDKKNGVQDSSSASDDAYSAKVIAEARPIFLSSLCTTVVTGFMQWTGMLGKLPTSPVLEALIQVFYAQLKLSKDILNPDMFGQGERPRCLQISKARGVASSLLAISIQETIDAGRLKKGHQDAIEGASFRMMLESTSPVIAPWIMGDTMEHMLRLDFFILMQLFCQKLEVPGNIGLQDLKKWLETGGTEHCPALQRWIQPIMNGGRLVTRAPLDKRGASLTELGSCMYITHPTLSCIVPDPGMSFDSMVCEFVGLTLFKQFSFVLAEDCQIHENASGEEIIKVMMISNANQQFTWPAIFGDIDSLPNFWMNKVPGNPTFMENLALSPIRVVITEAHRAAVCVDIRWLLLVSSLCGNKPSQASRHLVVGQWIQQFYANCVPDRMITSKELFIGLPSPVMHGGFVCPPVVKSGKRLLSRPVLLPSVSSFVAVVGTQAPIASGMIEDLGPAAPRYQLARLLNIEERLLPTNCVRYSLPHDQWTPVRIDSDGSFGSLKTCNDGLFWLLRDDQAAPINITASQMSQNDESFLDGRVNIDIRPLCVFDRPGVLIHHNQEWTGMVTTYEQGSGKYNILKSNGDSVRLDPYQTEDAVVNLGSKVYVKMTAFSDWKDEALFYTRVGREGEVGGADVQQDDVLVCTLSVPADEDMPEGTAVVEFQQHTEIGTASIAFFGSSQIGNNHAARAIGQSVNVHVSHMSVSCPQGVTTFLSAYTQFF
jgi:hypothetical protein